MKIDWKEFFKPTFGKIIGVGLLYLFAYIMTHALTIFSMIGLINYFTISMTFLYTILNPFPLILSSSWNPLNLIFYYLIACVVLYAKNNAKSRKLFAFILILTLILSFSGSYFFWNSEYWSNINTEMLESKKDFEYVRCKIRPEGLNSIENIKGECLDKISDNFGVSKEYPEDVKLFNNVMIGIYLDELHSTQDCAQINSEATFNNGENIRDKCFGKIYEVAPELNLPNFGN